VNSEQGEEVERTFEISGSLGGKYEDDSFLGSLVSRLMLQRSTLPLP
jgi:hypothetical protein